MSEPYSDPLSKHEVHELAETLQAWAETHPAPDVPLLGFASEPTLLSPRAIADAVSCHAKGEETGESHAILRLFQFATEVKPFSDICEELAAVSGQVEVR